MQPYQDFTWHELASQPAAWAETLSAFRAEDIGLRRYLVDERIERVVFTGCGSTYYLAVAAAAALRELVGIESVGLPASEIWLNSAAAIPGERRTLLVPVSRSGETTETLRAVEAFRQRSIGPVLTISCYGDRPLARLGDVNLVVEAGQEQSVAQTRAFSTQYLMALALAALWGGHDDLLAAMDALPGAGAALLAAYHPLAKQLADPTHSDRLFILGSGARYGLASEISLKCKEMSLSHSEPFHFLEYRHGPQSMAGRGALILGVLGERSGSYEREVLAEMRALGATVVAVGAEPADVALPALPELLWGPLALLFGQMLAYERAVQRELTPDTPHQLSAVVKLS